MPKETLVVSGDCPLDGMPVQSAVDYLYHAIAGRGYVRAVVENVRCPKAVSLGCTGLNCPVAEREVQY